MPHVIEPAVSIERIMVALLVDAYDEEVVGERERTVLRLHPEIAPVSAAVLPLIGKSDDMVGKARGLYEELRRHHIVEYDDSGAIGRRYRRQDEIGTPFAFTIDEQTLERRHGDVPRPGLACAGADPARGRARMARRRARPGLGLAESGLGAAQRAQPEVSEVLVGGGDHRERVAGGALRQAGVTRFCERTREQRLDAGDPGR